MQLTAALRVIHGASVLAADLQLKRSVAEALAQAATTLIFGGSACCWLEVLARSPAARHNLSRGPTSAAAFVQDQLEVVQQLLVADPQLAAPSGVLAWLAACTDVLLAAGDDPEGKSNGGRRAGFGSSPAALHVLTCGRPTSPLPSILLNSLCAVAGLALGERDDCSSSQPRQSDSQGCRRRCCTSAAAGRAAASLPEGGGTRPDGTATRLFA